MELSGPKFNYNNGPFWTIFHSENTMVTTTLIKIVKILEKVRES